MLMHFFFPLPLLLLNQIMAFLLSFAGKFLSIYTYKTKQTNKKSFNANQTRGAEKQSQHCVLYLDTTTYYTIAETILMKLIQ